MQFAAFGTFKCFSQGGASPTQKSEILRDTLTPCRAKIPLHELELLQLLLRARGVVQQDKPQLEMPTFRIKARFESWLCTRVQLPPFCTLGGSRGWWLQCLGACQPGVRPALSSWLCAGAQPCPGCFLGTWAMNRLVGALSPLCPLEK